MSNEAHEKGIEAAWNHWDSRPFYDNASADMKHFEESIKAYLSASGLVLCDAEPVVFAHHNGVSNGYGFIVQKDQGMIWDFAAQEWSNADTPLYEIVDPFESKQDE